MAVFRAEGANEAPANGVQNGDIVMSGENDNEQMPHRVIVDYENTSQRFRMQDRTFGNQYSHLYFNRLITMRRGLIERAQQHWGIDVDHVDQVLKIEPHERCFIVGTLYKDMVSKPNILEEVARDQHLPPPPRRAKYLEDSDSAILEDQSGRVHLTGKIEVKTMITGSVIAVLGFENDSGDFEVEDICFPGLNPQVPLARDLPQASGPDTYVALISGLHFGSNSTREPLLLELFVDYVCGILGGEDERAFESRIARVIVAGNMLGQAVDTEEAIKAKYLTRNTNAGSVGAVKALDQLLSRLSASVPVDVMPGTFDPSNHTLPQQPLHPCMLPKAARIATVQGVTNPYEARLGGVKFLGSSGQPVDDIYRFVSTEDRCEILENTLRLQLLAPTAPDTLACYPFNQNDPFIIEDCPHVYFCGNQPSFATKIVADIGGQEVRIINIPVFATTGTVVLVNLATLNCHPMTFELDV